MVAGSAASVPRVTHRAQQIARECLLLATAIALYFGVRGLINTRIETAYRNAEYVVDLERSAGVFVEPRLQSAVTEHLWLVDLLGDIYIYGHWPVILTTVVWLLFCHRDAYPRFRNAILISGAIGLVIFATFPVAPPRFLTQYGFVDTVTERTSAYRVLQPPAFVNQYAAVPSLHFGWNLLMGIAVATLAGHWAVRLFGWVMPILMFAAIVLTANHYLFDGIAGGAIALLGLLVATRLDRRRPRRDETDRRPVRPRAEVPAARSARVRTMRFVAVLAAAGMLVACTSGSGPKQTQRLGGQPMAACTISGERPVRAQAAALCGTLQVPEDRSKPDGRRIGLRVAVVPAVNEAQPDPLFVVAGGPGDAGTQFFAWLPSVFGDVHATRDIVLVDQRGTGDSNAMTLPEMPATAGLTAAAADARLSTWSNEALGAVYADPRFYTTAMAADDLDDVRAALGYDKIDLYGTSYGGTLVQYYVRQHGDHVRAAVLDGASPVDVPVFERMGANSQAALDLLLRRCAHDAACHAAFPRLTAEWSALLKRLAKPVTVVGPDGTKAVIDQSDLAEAIHTALLTESTAAQIPLAVHRAFEQQWIQAARLIGAAPSGGPTLLMADEIFCSEAWARFQPANVVRQGAGSYALPWELAKAKERAAMCRHMPKGVVPTDDAAAVRTTTPMLWLVGDGDPQDPPANLARVPAQQPNSRIVVMPVQEHVIGHLGCTPSVIAAFLTAGTADHLDTSCVTRQAPATPFRLK